MRIQAVGFLFRTRKKRVMEDYLKKIDSTYKEFSADVKECRRLMLSIKEEIDSVLHKNKIEKLQYDVLTRKINGYLRIL